MIFISINSNEIDEYITENNDFGVLNFHTARVCFIELEKAQILREWKEGLGC